MALHLKSTGIDFADFGHGSGSMSSELMDDYEEGTWSPLVLNVAGTTTNGYYTKAGNMCHVGYYYDKTDTSTSNANTGDHFFLSGFPFTAINQTNYNSKWWNDWLMPSTAIYTMSTHLYSNTTIGYLYHASQAWTDQTGSAARVLGTTMGLSGSNLRLLLRGSTTYLTT